MGPQATWIEAVIEYSHRIRNNIPLNAPYHPIAQAIPVPEAKGQWWIKDYSDKSFAIYGDTKPFKEELKNLGGKFNPNLKDGPGWIFSMKHKEAVQKWAEEQGNGPEQN
jgi:hypothetical protein